MDPGKSPIRSPAAAKPLPDYTAKSVKLRIFLWVGAIMLSLWAIDAARDAKTWQWLKSLDEPPQVPFRNDLANAGWRTADDPAGTVVATAPLTDDTSQFDPAEKARHSGWRQIWDHLSSDERSLLFELLQAAAAHHPLPAERQPAADQLIAKLATLWNDYDSSARQSLANLPSADRDQWTAMLDKLTAQVTNETLPALKSAGAEQAGKQHYLDDLSKTLIALARRETKDDTVVFRPAEQEIWFAEMARVKATTDKRTPAAPRVAYLQLHNQPAEYRGQFVTVKGTVRLAYRVPATENYLGIKEYFVYWLQPEGGPDSPILVYAIGVPPGFPAIAAEKPENTRRLPLREPVEVSGIFFKRAAYAAQGGLFTAPLIIADVPRWHPQPALATASSPFTTLEFIAAAIAALLLAVCVTAVLWKRTARRRAPASQRGGFPELGPLEIGPSPLEKIRELERQARTEGQT